MIRYDYWMALGFLIAISACHSSTNKASQANLVANPFFEKSQLPYQAPAFDQIHSTDFRPAFERGFQRLAVEIERIATNPQAPTFANTLVALEKSGQLLNRVTLVFNQLVDANADSLLLQLQQELAPKQASSRDMIFLNAQLYERIKTVYQQSATHQLDPESAYLLHYYKQQFDLAGAALSPPAKAQLKQLNREEASLVATFNQQLERATQAGGVLLDKPDYLAGLPESDRTTAAQEATKNGHPGQWLFPLQNPTQQSALQWFTNRRVRQQVFEASLTRAEKNNANDTRATIIRLATIRATKARLIGYKTYADWRLQDQMAQTSRAVAEFLAQFVSATRPKVAQEAARLQAHVDRQKGGFTLQAWDWDFVSEQIRQEEYKLNEKDLAPYFELNNVLQNGLFYAATQLYGITFRERHDLPVYQPDVRVFEVVDHTQVGLGLIYFDLFKRNNKRGGGWANSFVDQSTLLGTKPVVYNACNFTPSAAGQPTLLTYANIITLFHEFGHELHRLFSNQRYRSLSSSNIASDFVEFPSQFNEHWALHPQVVRHYARHIKTNLPLPDSLLMKLVTTAQFNQGYRFMEALAADNLDLQWHTIAPTLRITDADRFERSALEKQHVYVPLVPPRYRSSYFRHIWADGYAAGYYGYRWSELLAATAFEWFQKHGGLTRGNGEHFRKTILARGHAEAYKTMFTSFNDHKATLAIRALLASRGLINK